MKKAQPALFIILLLVLVSCANDNAIQHKEYFTINVDGKNYLNQYTAGSVITDVSTCTEGLGAYNFVLMESVDFYLYAFLYYYIKDVDFKKSEKGTTNLFDNFDDGCTYHLDFSLAFNGYSLDSTYKNLHQITNISKLKQDTISVQYSVEGEFNSRFLDKKGKRIPVSGSYSVIVNALK